MAMNGHQGVELNRLRWKCRRGMLELDEILMRYLELGYPAAGPALQQAFVELLEQEDPLLNRWLILGETADPCFRSIVRQVRGR